MEGEKHDVELDAAAKAIRDSGTEDAESDEQEPTTEDAGPMTPTAGSVEEANAQGVNPDK